jgi:hypothetical protein
VGATAVSADSCGRCCSSSVGECFTRVGLLVAFFVGIVRRMSAREEEVGGRHGFSQHEFKFKFEVTQRMFWADLWGWWKRIDDHVSKERHVMLKKKRKVIAVWLLLQCRSVAGLLPSLTPIMV